MISTIKHNKYILVGEFLVAETETLNNFCPSRFSQVYAGFDFHQKRKSRHTCENLDRYVCRDLRLEENAKLSPLEEI